MPVASFMRRHWQRRPLLIRGLFAPAEVDLDPAALFRLAARDDVESRLVQRRAGRWSLAHGPFAPGSLPSLRRRDWTLLVQGVEGHLPQAAALLARFRFLPDARLDDVMASFATAGGGVGPHIDSYDVFLVQARGHRRWRIASQRDTTLVPGAPLKILANFAPTDEWVLAPGDVLYLPPGIAHEGTALDACITCSVGFRAPAWAELAEPVLRAVTEDAPLAGRYGDRGATAVDRPARLPAAMVDALLERFRAWQLDRRNARRVLLEYLSEPKPHVVFERPRRPLALARFVAAARARGVRFDLRTRCLYAGNWFGINGDVLQLEACAAAATRRLADRRCCAPAEVATMLASGARRDTDGAAALWHDWYVAGWLHVGAPAA